VGDRGPLGGLPGHKGENRSVRIGANPSHLLRAAFERGDEFSAQETDAYRINVKDDAKLTQE
jgi:hypothetical protein